MLICILNVYNLCMVPCIAFCRLHTYHTESSYPVSRFNGFRVSAKYHKYIKLCVKFTQQSPINWNSPWPLKRSAHDIFTSTLGWTKRAQFHAICVCSCLLRHVNKIFVSVSLVFPLCIIVGGKAQSLDFTFSSPPNGYIKYTFLFKITATETHYLFLLKHNHLYNGN